VTKKTKRARRAVLVGLTKAGFVIGGYVTPHLAARAAAKVWCKLPRTAGRRKDNRAKPGRLAHVTVRPGERAVVEEWGDPEAPIIYLVHGWGGWRGQVASFAKPLVEGGFRVITFDALSHGDADAGEHGPRHSSGGEMVASLAAVAAHYGPAAGVIGHSLGCATSARAILEGTLVTERLTMVAPNPDMAAVARNFGKMIGFPARTIGLMERAAERWAHRSLDDFTIPPMAATGKLPAGLVIHDRADKESRYRTATEIDAAWEGARLMTTEGYGHHRILIAPAVVKAATDHVMGRDTEIPVPPAGAGPA
jgi:pimeloyl-ACP methyl ester carboxylesterase